MLNQNRFEEFADPRVRRAFMYIFDTEIIGEIAKGSGGYYVPSTYTGLPDPHAEGLFDDADLEHFSADHAQATSLLEEAGWTNEDDGWHKPNGDLAEYEIVGVEGWTDFSLTGEQATSQLSEFGINVTYRNMPDDGNQWGAWGAGDFDIAVRQWANPFVPYTWGSWQMNWFTDNSGTEDAPVWESRPGSMSRPRSVRSTSATCSCSRSRAPRTSRRTPTASSGSCSTRPCRGCRCSSTSASATRSKASGWTRSTRARTSSTTSTSTTR
ncbi:hypothetical protein GCM10029992_05960 [Glycomyces albus]